jgi:hypothetical protein
MAGGLVYIKYYIVMYYLPEEMFLSEGGLVYTLHSYVLSA